MHRIDELLGSAEKQLAESDTARLDAEVLLAHLLGQPRSYLRAYPERCPEPDVIQEYHRLLSRRRAGEPVAHLTGHREFWSMNILVTPDTLIPRPDTELLVEETLQCLATIDSSKAKIKLADLGTGSGAIALAIASECPHCEITATDLSTAALAVATTNAEQHKLTNIQFVHSHWCSAFAGDDFFDVIVSNPPYIPSHDPHMGNAELACEPALALTSGIDGLDALRCITAQAKDFLSPGGWLLVEHGYDQGKAVQDLFQQQGFCQIETKQDLAGHDRICRGSWRGY